MENKELKMNISPEIYNEIMEKNINVTQESILSLFNYEDELRESVNNWLCKTANEQHISLFSLCDMFDIDIVKDYEPTDDHSMKVNYNFTLVPKKLCASTAHYY